MKKHRDPEPSAEDALEGDDLRKNSSCFSNIKIFLISECALMLAQGTVGAYLVSAISTHWCEPTTWRSRTDSCLCVWRFCSGTENPHRIVLSGIAKAAANISQHDLTVEIK